MRDLPCRDLAAHVGLFMAVLFPVAYVGTLSFIP